MKTGLLLGAAFISLVSFAAARAGEPGFEFIKVKSGHFVRGTSRYTYMGANFWYGMNLGSRGIGGDRPRLLRELNQIQSLGISNLRIVAASEGPDSEPWRIGPALQSAPGQYNPDVLEGLDFLLDEMGKRHLSAVVILNNFWSWSGGMGQYRHWAGADAIPYPPPEPGGSWDKYNEYASLFYSDSPAKVLAQNHIAKMISRVNSINGVKYSDDPTIMAWELANEPRGLNNRKAMNQWIEQTSNFIRSLDRNHLVTTGSEGELEDKDAGLNLVKNHSFPNIDYVTAHLWVQNWGWYEPQKTKTFSKAVNHMHRFFDHQVELAASIGKPLVLEEFGLARDKNSYDPKSPTTYKDRYYADVFDRVYQAALTHDSVAGVNFWAWAGEGRPVSNDGPLWKRGDPFVGDPAQEPQGWYSVFNTDTSTLGVISTYAQKLSLLK